MLIGQQLSFKKWILLFGLQNPERSPTADDFSPPVFDGSRVAHHFSFLCCLNMCVYVLSLCCGNRYEFCIKNDVGSSLPPVVCRRAHVLYTLFVFVCVQWCSAHFVLCFCCCCLSSYCVLSNVVSNTYCVVFFDLFVFALYLVYPMLSVSLDCPFLIVPSVSLTYISPKKV